MELNEVNPQVEPRPAATVVLMRDSPWGLHVLLTVRPDHLRFMGGASVFPGGAVSDADLDPRWERAASLDRAAAAAALGSTDGATALGAFVCALRETFEEVGYLHAIGDSEALSPADAEDPGRFLQRCLDLGIVLDCASLVPAGRWVTPLGSPVRFDARFFVTAVADDFVVVPDPDEVASWAWITPAEALAELASGDRVMAPPTIEMLQRLEGCGSVADALAGFGTQGLLGAGNVLSLRVSPLVHVVLAPNAGIMTGPGTNTYVVGSGPYLVIDPAVDDDGYVDAVMAACEGVVGSILVTHRHPDHVGGAVRLARESGAPVRAWGSDPAGGAAVTPIGDGEVVRAGGVELAALHTPGHASDHLCFHMRSAASLFSGDAVLGEGTAVIAPPDGDMRAYLDTLHRLLELPVDRIYPGHWKPLDGGRRVIAGYIAHRKEREAKILQAVGREPASLDEIVTRAYSDTPEHLHAIARFSARAHLDMLADEGRVERNDDRWTVVDEG